MTTNQNKSFTGPGVLPLVLYEGKQFYADLRLREFRPVKGLLDSISFDSKEGKAMCTQAGVVSCKSCKMSVIVSRAYQQQELRCMQCFSRIEPQD